MTVTVSRPTTSGYDPERLNRVSSALRDDIESGRIHGAAMMVSFRGDVVLDFVGGYQDKAFGRPLKRDAVFLTMSVSKAIVNVLVLNLVERGLLRLHSPVAEVLPEFAQQGKATVNLAHLLTHTAGLPQAMPPVAPDVLGSIEQLTSHVCDLPMAGTAGESVSYSMIVAESVIAAMCLRVAGDGRNFAAMLDDDVLRPLGMHETSLGLRPDLADRVCPVRMAKRDTTMMAAILEQVGELFATPGIEIPAGAMFTTIKDLHRFTEMLRRGGEYDGVRLLSPAMLEYSTRNFTGSLRNMVWDSILPSRDWLPTPANLGLGFHVQGKHERPCQCRFGVLASPRAFGGFGAGSSGCWVDPDRDLGISFLSTGLLEESEHVERTGVLSDMIISSLI
ncbi:serine hydrolase domain-containing protein [Amycolatopsis sp. NBC_01480]|uniref:serine hydrolase domain-containing protein n=1 Tax=Amycolatopsis sp. NBC_01480 TaxID=2903562 RepID=UPI002E2C0915|nr:serine hydrolase domain-containing protein [Amycolatopsis sp. NBC_01480]